MAANVSVVLNWVLLLALFPLAFFWLRRAYRIAMQDDYSEVALKRGEPPADARRWAPYEMAINGLAGLILAGVIVGVLGFGLAYDSWTAIAGSTIWCKFFGSFALGRHAHTKGMAARR